MYHNTPTGLSGYGEVLWSPTSEDCLKSNLSEFVRGLEGKGFKGLDSWAELHQWSIEHPTEFWREVAAFYGIDLTGVFDGEWFQDDQLNFAQILMQGNANKASEALISYSEDGVRRSLTWGQLQEQVQSLASHFVQMGITPGDCIAGVLPNQIEAALAALATIYVGGIWTSCSPDFGEAALLDRLGQARPKILIACDAYLFKGRQHSVSSKIVTLNQSINSVQHLIWVPLAEMPESKEKTEWLWSELFENKTSCNPDLGEFNRPLYILYSSGTTGKPKCIVHGAGGTLLQHLKELGLHTDIKPGEKLFYFSTCGWMMWNWLLSGLGVGATLVLFDGHPLFPEPDHLLKIAEKEKLHHFGASAKYYAALHAQDVKGYESRLPHLRTILSTGSPLLPETFDYLYRDIHSQVRVASISGGTDIVSCFALGNPWLPVRRGELQAPGLGMAVAIFNEDGEPVIDERGELVCTQPFPSQPLGFLDDPDHERFKKAYFSRFKNVWAQGDYAIMTKTGGLVILGRSDAVLNPGGVRIGTAEIYRQLENITDIVDALACGYQTEGDEQIWLFVVLKPNKKLTAALESEIRQHIKANTSPRHVPAKIIHAPDLPRTRNGKLAELAVKKLINGQVIDNAGAFENPECLQFFSDLVRVNLP